MTRVSEVPIDDSSFICYLLFAESVKVVQVNTRIPIPGFILVSAILAVVVNTSCCTRNLWNIPRIFLFYIF